MDKVSDGLRVRGIEGLWLAAPSIMLALNRMTAVVVIAIAILLGTAGMRADANGQYLSNSDVEQIAVANNGKVNLASNINWIERNKLKEIHYKLENGRTKKLEISNITNTKIEFDNYTEWVANFAENGMNPYSPGHSNIETTIASDIPENFLESSKGTTLRYKVQEEWNNNYGMLWEIDVKIEKSEIVNFKNTNIEAVVLNLIGRSIEQNGFKESSWHHTGVTFKETQVIDKRSKVLLSRERTWENRTSRSPENEHQIQTLDKLKYRDGTVISWTELAQILRNEERRKAELALKKAEEKRKAELARKKAEAEIARKKAEEKKRNSLVRKIKTKASAKQLLSDLRNFIKENPEELDSLKVAELFSPSIAEAEDGSFSDKGSTFKKLVVFVGKSRQFNTYYRERSKERTASLKKKKLASLNKLKSGVKSLKNKIASDPLNPSAVKWIQMIKKYEKINIQSSLKSLRKYVVKLDKGMRASGVEPNFSVAQSINSKKKRKAELARKKAEEKRKTELVRKKAEEKKNKAAIGKIKTKASAKLFLSDIRGFIKENPGELDPLKVAKLYAPSTAEAKEGKFSKKNSKFSKLESYVSGNKIFRTYYRERSKERAASLKKKKHASLDKLKSGISSLKNKITSDPLNSSAVAWIQMVETYEKINIQSSLKSLRKHVITLDKGMRASGVRPEFSVAQNIPSSGSQKSKSGRVSSKTKRSSLNLGGVLDSDLIALAHVSNNSPNAYRDLDGKIKFEENKVIACAPSIKKWKSQEQYYFNTQFRKKYRNAEIRFQKDCSKSLNGTDLLIVKGIDFSKSLKIPKESVLAKAFRTKELSIIVKATAKGLENERNKREILSDQYKADILGDSRLGFGALTVNKRSEIGCIVLDQDPAPHQNSITSALEARSFQFGDKTPNLLKVDTATAFRQLQRGKCGIVYGGHIALKKILEGSNKINLSTIVLPVWVSQRSIDKEAERLSKASQNKQVSEAKRTEELKRRLAEERIRKEKEAAALSNRQSEHRTKYGPKVASIISGIESELIEVRKSLEVSIQANKNLQEAVSEEKLQFYSPFPTWYGKKVQGGWHFDSIVSVPHDYGVGTWRDRQMEAVISKVRVLMKNRRLGEYSDDCWFVGYLIDGEFGMKRNSTVSMCKNEEVHKNWLIDHGFKTRWKFVPE